MKKKVDFLFVYEVKNRELENICLLRYELERRGYSVEFINTWYYRNKPIPKIKAHVLVSFALYNDDVYSFVSKYCYEFKKIINLQWEQTVSIRDEKDPSSVYYIKGFPVKAVHIAWGIKTFERLISCGVKKDNVKITGHIGMDFLHEKLNSYYMSREELFNLYNIPIDKEVCLFISSFSAADSLGSDNSGKEKVDDSSQGLIAYDWYEYVSVSTLSQNAVLEWISRILQKRDDLVFVYRPHPAEYTSAEFIEMLADKKGLFAISDHSIAQWIRVCDVITVWHSTSLAEIFFGKKSCHILRPVEMPLEMELALYKDAKLISTYREFERVFDNKSSDFPVDEVMIRKYYAQEDGLNYINVCNAFEEIIEGDVHNHLSEIKYHCIIKTMKRIKRKLVCTKSMRFLSDIFKNHFSVFMRIYEFLNADEYTRQMQRRNYATHDEIEAIIEKIRTCLEE